MIEADRDLERARLQVRVTRQRLATTMREIQDRLNPRVLLREAWTEVRERGDVLAGEAIDAARNRPAAVAGIAAAVAAIALRHPIGRAAAKLFFSRRETESADDQLETPNRSPAPRSEPSAGPEQGV